MLILPRTLLLSIPSTIAIRPSPNRTVATKILNFVSQFQLPGYDSSVLEENWDPKTQPVVFIHIVKSGGTSFDKTVAPIVHELGGKYRGFKHFDWSWVEAQYPEGNARIAVQMRNPVDRAISNFYHLKTLNFTEHLDIRKQSLLEYLQDPRSLLRTRSVWHDGQAGIDWLAGTHNEGWVDTDHGKSLEKREIHERDMHSMNFTGTMLRAAANLRKTYWLGLLEYRDESLEMLASKLGYSLPIDLEVRNVHHGHEYLEPNDALKAQNILSRLLPMDMWLYEYAERLFSARYIHFKTGHYVDPQLPEFPDIQCTSTKWALRCSKPDLYYVLDSSDDVDTRLLLK